MTLLGDMLLQCYQEKLKDTSLSRNEKVELQKDLTHLSKRFSSFKNNQIKEKNNGNMY